MFREIAAKNFPPFEELRLKLPPVENRPAELAEVHLFTGVNGTGKTRLLCTLAAMLGHIEPLAKTLKGMDSPVEFSLAEQHNARKPPESWSTKFHAHVSGAQWIGATTQFQNWAKQVPAFAYCGTAYVTDAPIAAIVGVPRPVRNLCLSFNRPETHSNELLQAIANLKVQAAMDLMNDSANETSSTRSAHILRALETSIGEITGAKFSFQMTTYPQTSLEVNWGGTKLLFDLLPDGLRSIIGWLGHAVVMMDVWLQGKSDPTQTEAVFLLDEIESHLHPAWQRKILPAFQRLFPKAQIFVATHSPFVIASLNFGWIHRLTLRGNAVTAEEPIAASTGDSYVSVIEDIMGIKEWYDPETEQLLGEFRSKRDAAYRGEPEAEAKARQLAAQIGGRSMELDYMMGRELSQMDRQLARAGSPR